MTEYVSNNGQHADSAEKARGSQFQPGQSGNPGGRPRGSRNKSTLLAEAMLEGEAETIALRLIGKVRAGDSAALRLLVERLVPRRRHQPVQFDLPVVESAADALKASSAVMAACAAGELTIPDARDIMDMIARHVRLIESSDLEPRIEALEKQRRSSGRSA